MKKRAKKKVRRVVLGVGHPWFFSKDHGFSGLMYDSVMLTEVMLTEGHGLGGRIPINYKDVGNWNKVRLVMEVLK